MRGSHKLRGAVLAQILSSQTFSAAALAGGGVFVAAPMALAETPRDEIVVTARLRDESLQDVPVAVSAFSGAQLERQNITDANDLIGRVPGLFFSQNQSFGPSKTETYIVMRGVGATSALEPAVAVFVDGVYVPKMMFDIDFAELERVEVLRGPQGALFGRNTQGGALNIITRKPDDDFRARIALEGDEFETIKALGAVSGPVLPGKVFVGLSGSFSSTNGYIDNATLGVDQDDAGAGSFRATLRALPTDSLEFILVGGFGKNWGGQLGAGVPEGNGDYVVFDDQIRDLTDDIYNASLTVNWDLDFATLTSITGGVKTDTETFWDWDGGPVATGNFQLQKIEQSQISQEFRLASNPVSERLDWLGGLYLFRSVYDQDRDFGLVDGTGSTLPILFDPNNIVDEQARFVNEGVAVFGQATFRPVPRLDLTFGARYSYENVESRQFGEVTLVGLGSQEIFDVSADEYFSRFSPMGSIAYRWTDGLMTYVTVAEGFKAGGFQKYPASELASGVPFDNEISLNYEIGFKSNFLDGRVTLNAAAYIIEVKEQQLGTIREINNIPVELIDNVGRSTNRGFEVEAIVLPVEGLRLSGSAAYVDAEFDEFVNEATGRDRGGERIPYVPEWTAQAMAEYAHKLTQNAEATWSVEYRYVGAHLAGNGAPPFDPFFDIDAYDIVDARVRINWDNWELTVFAENLFDQYNVQRKWEAPFQDRVFDTPLPPRRLGARVGYAW